MGGAGAGAPQALEVRLVPAVAMPVPALADLSSTASAPGPRRS